MRRIVLVLLVGCGAGSDAQTVATLACPEPGELPFQTSRGGFEDPQTETILKDNPLVAHEAFDLFGLPSVEQEIVGRMAHATSLLDPVPIAGEFVSLWTFRDGWQELGRIQTDDDGRYAFALGDGDAFAAGTHEAFAVLEGNGECAAHGVFLWPETTSIVISDIDGTLTYSDQELISELGDPTYDQVENQGASTLANAWVDQGYVFLYLTARPHSLRTMTRSWLADHEFPFMPLVTADGLLSGESARKYKRDVMQIWRDGFSWVAEAAYGNATSDIDAYEDVEIPKSVTFIIGDKAGADGTVAIPDHDFTEHIETYVLGKPSAPSEQRERQVEDRQTNSDDESKDRRTEGQRFR